MARTLRGTAVTLTREQARILARCATGLTVSEIAREEFVSERAMYAMLQTIRDACGCRSLTQAVLVAHVAGYLSVPDDDGLVLATSPYAQEEV